MRNAERAAVWLVEHPNVAEEIVYFVEPVTPTETSQAAVTTPPWCKCGRCVQSADQKPVERVCCRRTHGMCILQKETQLRDILRPHVVRADHGADQLRRRFDRWQFENHNMRFQAYSHTVAHLIGGTGAGNRVVVPACVVGLIHQRWPSPDGVYSGLRRAERGGRRVLHWNQDDEVEEYEGEDV